VVVTCLFVVQILFVFTTMMTIMVVNLMGPVSRETWTLLPIAGVKIIKIILDAMS